MFGENAKISDCTQNKSKNKTNILQHKIYDKWLWIFETKTTTTFLVNYKFANDRLTGVTLRNFIFS